MTDVLLTDLGRVAVAQRELSRLVVRAAEGVDGARVRRPRRGLHLEIADGRAHVSLELTVRRGCVLYEVARAVQGRVAEALATMLEVRVEGVDVTVEGIDA
jgi:uncharacterized alkaline shock family protein YloU